MDKEKLIELSIEGFYDYTKDTVKSYEESFVRMDNRSTLFIGFAGTLLRLALDLRTIQPNTVYAVCLFCIITALIAVLALGARETGEVTMPENLIEDKSYLDGGKPIQQWVVTHEYIKLLKEYRKLVKKKQCRINLTMTFLCFAIISYGLGVAGCGDEIIKSIYILLENFAPSAHLYD